jgi:hypothetical protein
MRFCASVFALLLTAGWLTPAQVSHGGSGADRKKPLPPVAESIPDLPKPAALPVAAEKLTYDVEWRLIHAGEVMLQVQRSRADMTIESAGLVSSLFKVHDTLQTNFDDFFCASGSLMNAQEGKRRRETKVNYDRSRNRAASVERDLINDSVVHMSEVDTPNCVHDVVGALLRLRNISIEPGQSAQLPLSDGRRSASVKIDAQEREDLKTPAGPFKAVRCEVYIMNNVIYARKGRVFVWLSDDARRTPVQIRLRLPFPIGTVTLQLEKQERS